MVPRKVGLRSAIGSERKEGFLYEAMDQALIRLEHAIGGLLERIEGERIERHALGAALDAARLGIESAASEIRHLLGHAATPSEQSAE